MLKSRHEIKKKLERLYPGESSERKYREYRLRQKRLIVCLMVLGLSGSVCSFLWRQTQKEMFEKGGPVRREWGEGNYRITLSAQIGEKEEEITYLVEERQYTEEELQYLLQQVTKKLPEIIKGQNESLTCVRKNLVLPAQHEEYPFTIAWKSSDYRRLRTNGEVNTQELPQGGEEITLTALLSCQGNTYRREFPIRLYPEIISEEADATEQLKNMITESDERSRQKSVIPLPEKLGEDKIIWQEHIAGKDGYFLLLGVIGGIAGAWGMNRELDERDKERQKELTASYPEFVSSLQLYLGAGLSLRNAFFRLGNEYRLQKKANEKTRFLYEEVVLACNRLANGEPEPEVYRKWAERCNEVHYRKLGYLLVSYSRRGNGDILRQLGKEAYHAWEECRQKVRKQGEEAGTKMVFPMVLMLLVVMMLILLPIYVGF